MHAKMGGTDYGNAQASIKISTGLRVGSLPFLFQFGCQAFRAKVLASWPSNPSTRQTKRCKMASLFKTGLEVLFLFLLFREPFAV
jgi:hypothetical protein